MSKISPQKYGIWILFVGVFSAFPILVNILLDYIANVKDVFEWRGVRVMDFLTCGFCLIGGALCDRYINEKHPSPFAVFVGIMMAVGAFVLYLFTKYTSLISANDTGFYPKEDFLVQLIMISYAGSLIYSLFVLRKTLIK